MSLERKGRAKLEEKPGACHEEREGERERVGKEKKVDDGEGGRRAFQFLRPRDGPPDPTSAHAYSTYSGAAANAQRSVVSLC